MKKVLKAAYSNSVMFIETVISIFSIFFFSKISFKRNLQEAIYKKHDHCYIITNGSSFNTVAA